MGIRAVPPLFLLISFSLIGMAYVRVGVKITRIWWVMISVGWGTWLGLALSSSPTTFPNSLDFFLLLIF